MYVVAEFHDRERDGSKRLTPLLRFYIQDAPHRRMEIAVIQQYREVLRVACLNAGILLPISEPIDLSVYFINPTSPDLGNSYLALEQALDRYAPRGVNLGLLADDSLIQAAEMKKMWVNLKQAVGSPPPRLMAVA